MARIDRHQGPEPSENPSRSGAITRTTDGWGTCGGSGRSHDGHPSAVVAGPIQKHKRDPLSRPTGISRHEDLSGRKEGMPSSLLVQAVAGRNATPPHGPLQLLKNDRSGKALLLPQRQHHVDPRGHVVFHPQQDEMDRLAQLHAVQEKSDVIEILGANVVDAGQHVAGKRGLCSLSYGRAGSHGRDDHARCTRMAIDRAFSASKGTTVRP